MVSRKRKRRIGREEMYMYTILMIDRQVGCYTRTF
jgi:hypothetical protein